MVGAFRELTFLPIIIANTLVGIIQECRSKKILDKLAVLHAPKANVIRGGKKQVIRAEELVLDDVVIFTAGNQIPADAVVISGEAQVNESLITGEADEITKVQGDSLLSGSYIVSGRCLARLTKVGADSYVSKLSRNYHYSNWNYDVLSAIYSFGQLFAWKCDIDDSGDYRNDSGGTLPSCQCGACCQRDETGEEKSACARHEMY